MTDVFALFSRVSRLAMTDGDPAVALALRLLSAKDKVSTLHATCFLHKFAISYYRVRATVREEPVNTNDDLLRALSP